MEKKPIGKIAHYFTKMSVAVIDLSDELKVGDRISIEGATSNFEQAVNSMQIEHDDVKSATAGQSVGMKVDQRVRQGDLVFKIS
jgi:putative protease